MAKVKAVKVETQEEKIRNANKAHAKQMFWVRSTDPKNPVRLIARARMLNQENGTATATRWQTILVNAENEDEIYAIGNAMHGSESEAIGFAIENCPAVTSLWTDKDWDKHFDAEAEALIAKAKADAKQLKADKKAERKAAAEAAKSAAA